MSDEWIGKRVIPIEGNPAQLCSSVWTCRGYENGKLVLEGAPGIRYNLAPRYVMLAPEIEKKDVLERAKRVEYPDSALRILPGLIAEVEAKNKQIKELQDIINKPPEEAQWMTDYHLLQSALDGPIIESARRWHGAFRKAQNSNLIRRQQNERLEAEVERLRSHHIQIMGKIRAWILNDCAEVCRGFDWRDDEITRLRNESDAWKAKAIEERFQLLCCSEYEPPRTEASLRTQAARELEEEMQCKREE